MPLQIIIEWSNAKQVDYCPILPELNAIINQHILYDHID